MIKSKCGLFFYKFCPCNIPYCTIKITSCSIQRAARTRQNCPDNVACNLLHEKNGTNQTTWLNVRSSLGTFLPIHQNERKGISCIKMHATRIKTWLNQRRVQRAARTRQNYPDNVACNLLHEKNGTNQTMWLNVRSSLGRFYPFTTMNGKVFRASRCTLRESKTWLNQRRVQRCCTNKAKLPRP